MLLNLLDRVLQAKNYRLAGSIAGDLTDLLLNIGSFTEALRVSGIKSDCTRRAGLGPWTQLADRALHLRVIQASGNHDLVLQETYLILEQMAALPAANDETETVEPWNLRNSVLEVGRVSAYALDQFQTALELNRELRTDQSERGATTLELARIAFNDWAPLIDLKRHAEAEALLLDCRETFEAEESLDGLAVIYGAWADLEEERGHHDQAIGFEQRSLRLEYLLRNPTRVALSHNNLASYLVKGGRDTTRPFAHRLTAALLVHLSGSGELTKFLTALNPYATSDHLHLFELSYVELCEHLRRHDDLDLSELVTALFPTVAMGEDIIHEVIRQARAAVPVESPPRYPHRP